MDSLHVACRAGSVKNAFLLLCGGAYVDPVDSAGDTPLHWCLKVSGVKNYKKK
jgi:ankyrin repeat protein